MASGRILVVDDDQEVSELTEYTLTHDGYEVIRAFDGADGLEKARSAKPNLIVLDIDMPRVDGLEMCKQLRSDKAFRFVPIIMLTGSRTHPQDKIVGLEMGADDYLLKPFLPQELSLRIKNLLSRTEEQLSVNPLTRLPGSHTLKTEVTNLIEQKKDFAVCYFDLDNFKAFNDSYGYNKGDEVIRFTAELINKVISTDIATNDCLTHIGGDDLVLVTSADKVKTICEFVLRKFAEEIPNYYNEADRKAGHISTLNRKGEEQKFPIMTMTIACITNEQRKFEHYTQMVDILSETKKYAKSLPGNVWVKDRRKDKVAA